MATFTYSAILVLIIFYAFSLEKIIIKGFSRKTLYKQEQRKMFLLILECIIHTQFSFGKWSPIIFVILNTGNIEHHGDITFNVG